MTEVMLICAAVVSTWVGMALLAMSQPRHWQAVTGRCAAPARWMLGVAWLMLICSLLLTLQAQGPAFGVLLWPMFLGLAASAVALMLAWRPDWLRWVARIATV